MQKPRVQYSDIAKYPEIGCSARVFTRNHYRPQLTGWIRTSKVVKIAPGVTGPVFETLNTVYWPCDTDESMPEYTRAEKIT